MEMAFSLKFSTEFQSSFVTMSEDGKFFTGGHANDIEESDTDDEDDCEGFFLEAVGETVNVAEKIALANKQLFEEEEEDRGENLQKVRKVQFSEDLVNFEPDFDHASLESELNELFLDEGKPTALPKEPQEECNGELTINVEDPKTEETFPESKTEKTEEIAEEIIEDAEGEKKQDELSPNNSETSGNSKLLLFLFPHEQNSSCESLIGEDISENSDLEREHEKNALAEHEKTTRTKIPRPKSASNSRYKKSCEVAKISPDLNCSSNLERRDWFTTKKTLKGSPSKIDVAKGDGKQNLRKSTGKASRSEDLLKKINIDASQVYKTQNTKNCSERPKSSADDSKKKLKSGFRPKTAPLKRTCCVIKSDLPRYNGLRSEYGLSAEQLQERKQTTLQMKHQRKQKILRERQEEARRKIHNEEIFQKWLSSKSRKVIEQKSTRIVDTITRSDVYIKNHASYASNRNVPYSVNYNLNKKSNMLAKDSKEKLNKKLFLEKMFDKMSPHYKRSFSIYLGTR